MAEIRLYIRTLNTEYCRREKNQSINSFLFHWFDDSIPMYT